MTKCIARGSGGGASIIESEVRFDSGHWNFQSLWKRSPGAGFKIFVLCSPPYLGK